MIVHRYDALESTNLHLIKMAEDGAPAWTVVLADSQAAGMGRLGRAWWSPPGGLYMSVLIRPPAGMVGLTRIPILASLAVLDAVGETKMPLSVKWPNDILADGKKLAGILVQARAEVRRVAWVVAGFGVNIHRPECKITEKFHDEIAFLEDLRGDITREGLAEAIVTALRRRLDALDDTAWKQAMEEWAGSASWNKFYRHREGDREIRGVPVRLSDDGGLVLRTDGGEVTVRSGELIEAVQSSEC